MVFEYPALRVNTIKEMLEEELALVENYIKFLDRRRTGGLLYIPEELTFPNGVDNDEPSLEDIILETMLLAVRDETSPANIVPIILRGPAEFSDKIRKIDLDSEFRATLIARSYDIKKKIDELDNDEKSLV